MDGKAGAARRALEILLRVGVAMCFVGHGAFGILTKAAWLPYFGHGGFGLFERKATLAGHWAVLGLPEGVVPAAGALEIALGLLVLLRPTPTGAERPPRSPASAPTAGRG